MRMLSLAVVRAHTAVSALAQLRVVICIATAFYYHFTICVSPYLRAAPYLVLQVLMHVVTLLSVQRAHCCVSAPQLRRHLYAQRYHIMCPSLRAQHTLSMTICMRSDSRTRHSLCALALRVVIVQPLSSCVISARATILSYACMLLTLTVRAPHCCERARVMCSSRTARAIVMQLSMLLSHLVVTPLL